MKHARLDYNRIQDPAGLIPDDEPVFLLRGQDICAPEAVEAYAVIVQRSGGDTEIIRLSLEQARAMRKWHKEHTCHMPDLPEAPPCQS